MNHADAVDKDRNDPRSRWKRAVFLAGRIEDGYALKSNHEALGIPSPQYTKTLETQHWLELIDPFVVIPQFMRP